MTASALDWRPALEVPDLLAPATLTDLRTWAVDVPQVADEVRAAPIDPDLADTAALSEAYDLPLEVSANCVLVGGRRDGEDRVAACVVLATTRADVNSAVRRLLDVRKASFLDTARAVQDSGMEYGGITPVGLPTGWRLLVDERVARSPWVVIGSGVRRSKLSLPGTLLAEHPSAEVAAIAA